jgi:hypothetical protein
MGNLNSAVIYCCILTLENAGTAEYYNGIYYNIGTLAQCYVIFKAVIYCNSTV